MSGNTSRAANRPSQAPHLLGDDSPEVSFHCQTRATNASRPSSRRLSRGIELAFDHHLVAVPAVVCARLGKSVEAASMKARQGIRDRVLKSVAHVQRALGGGMTIKRGPLPLGAKVSAGTPITIDRVSISAGSKPYP